jgi:hypothetical protein
MQLDGLLEVGRYLVQGLALSHDRYLEAFRHVPGLLSRTDHRLDRSLQHSRASNADTTGGGLDIARVQSRLVEQLT